jgi:DNA polymerase II small subunit
MKLNGDFQGGREPTVEQVVVALLDKGVMIDPPALELLQTNPHLLRELDISSLGSRLTLETLRKIHTLVPVARPESKAERDALPNSPPDSFPEDEGVRILEEYHEMFDMKGEVSDFLNHFMSRYRKISALLHNRPELRSLASANRIPALQPREEVSLIGIVTSKRETRSGHFILEIEDETGQTKVLLSKNGPAIKKADEIVEDEIIAIRGQASRELVFAEEIIFPDVPQATTWPSKSKGVALLLSDTHIGSKEFLQPLFNRFVDWTNSNNEIARRVKYLMIAGDLVDGVGVYKGQQKDLAITDIEKQYDEFANQMDKITKRIRIFACPGNHDASRDSDPQPVIPAQFAPALYNLSNLTMTSSPSTIQLDGVTFLMYHGTALDSLIAAIPSLRKTGYDNPHQAMIQQLRKRHLIPIYNEHTRMFPDNEDKMVVETVPNVFHSGHVHKLGYSVYRGIRVINSGTFQDRTAFQVKIGHHPQPGKVPYVELGTGSIGILDFTKTQEEGGHAIG